MDFYNNIQETTQYYIENIQLDKLNELIDIIISYKNNNIYFLAIGKSYNVACHLSDLLKCMNFSSIVLDSSKILHGDIGMIKNTDLVILISNSGNTIELVHLIMAINNIKKCSTVLLSSKKGTLSSSCEHNFIVPFKKELDSCFGILPTNSVLNFIIYSNQIISLLVEKLKLKKNIYVENHSGGNIGEKYKKIMDYLIKKEDCCLLQKNQTIKEGIIKMNLKKIGCIIVYNGASIYGIVTDRDIRQYLEESYNINILIQEITNTNFYSLDNPNIFINDIPKKYNYIPIILNNNLLGVFQLK